MAIVLSIKSVWSSVPIPSAVRKLVAFDLKTTSAAIAEPDIVAVAPADIPVRTLHFTRLAEESALEIHETH
jgi:hypothetical protein